MKKTKGRLLLMAYAVWYGAALMLALPAGKEIHKTPHSIGVSADITMDVSKVSELASVSDRVDRLFDAWNRKDTPGCALAVVRDGKIVYERGYGMANLEYGIPNTPATIFPLASISKQFTAFAIHLLAQEGRLSLADDVRKYVPELHDFGKTITLRHLLNHTSGLRDYFNLLGWAGWREEDLMTEEDVLDIIWRQRELDFTPGEEAVYGNSGYALLGLIVKRVSGKSLRDFSEERIFGPLGMTHTHFRDDYLSPLPNRAYSYNPRDGGGFDLAIQNDAVVGGTGVYSNVEDLARWDQNFYDGRVGGKALLEEMQTKGRLNSGRELDTSAFEVGMVDAGYGSGLIIGDYRGQRTVEHGGGGAGWRNNLLRFPKQHFSVIVLANSGDFNLVGMPRKVADIYLEKSLKPEPAATPKPGDKAMAEKHIEPAQPSPEQLAEYTGEFYSDELHVLYSVAQHDGKLLLRHPRGEIALEYLRPDVFWADLPYRSGTIRYVRDAGKSCTGFLIDGLRGRIRGMRFVKTEIEKYNRK